ncbi:MAG: NAD(P)-dependent oxidoreductase, partial [Candidatus Marinimicrobia bacterium]|nr:NAD(P)-dependent oxidoreductase [Candidatus Neomarinimicrobiota bacterium]
RPSNPNHICFTMSEQEVTALKRSFSDTTRILPVLDKIVCYDVDLAGWQQLFQTQPNIEAILHTATVYGRDGESFTEIFDVNTRFALELLEYAVAARVNLFINADTSLPPETNAYALSKHQFQAWGRSFCEVEDINFINIRLEHMYGPGDDVSKFTSRVIRSCLDKQPELELTEGSHKRDFIYIDDVISGFMTLLLNDWTEENRFMEFDLGSGQPVAIRELVEAIHRLTDSRTSLKFGALPTRKNEPMTTCSQTDPLEVLGWSCKTSLEQGLQTTIAAFRNE